jgi:hypothetical protein
MLLQENCEEIIHKIKVAIKENKLPKKSLRDNQNEALEKYIISADEKKQLNDMFEACYDAILVDEYTLDEYKNL